MTAIDDGVASLSVNTSLCAAEASALRTHIGANNILATWQATSNAGC